MTVDLPELPIRAELPAVQRALGRVGRAVLVAPPGAGKTTLVPLALLEAPWRGDGRILVLEPRRLAARAAAHRMSRLLGEEGPGGTVGYRVRMDTRVGPRTRVEVVTEGVLTRMLQSDSALEGVAAVLFDEFHERSLHADVGLAMCLQSRAILRDDLRLLVMSATMDPGPVARLLGDAPVIRTEGRAHPVETRWISRPVEGWIEPAVSRTVRRALEETEGDLLVFLPGAGEIRRTREHLEGSGLPDQVRLHTLHGSLDSDAQDRAIQPAPPGTRKVVLASAIAETSLTIEGVRVVVDSGLMRVPRFDPGTGMTRLETLRVSRDSADQRRGRAGREAPGWCYRMWTRGEDRGLVPQRTPEILEADLAPLALELAAWGAAPDDLRWLDPPPAAAFETAHALLRDLELVDPEGGLTPTGDEVAALGIHPRLGRMLLDGKRLGWGTLACDLAALLSDRDVVQAEGRSPDADLRLRVELLRGGRGASIPVSGHRAHRGGLARVRREARHWRKALALPTRLERPSPEELEAVGLLASLAYPDRIGRLREGQRGRFLLSGGRGARFNESQSLEGADWIVAVDLEGRGREARIFRAAPLSAGHIETHLGGLVEETAEIAWDEYSSRVRARKVTRLGAIELASASLHDPDASRVAEALLEGVRSRGVDALPWGRDGVRLRDRLLFLHHLEPDRWPDTSTGVLEEELEEWLLPFLAGHRSWEDLRRVDLKEALLSRLDWARRNRLDALAPTHLEVPSGSRVPVDYSDPQRPALAVRLQEVFGWQETPRVGGSRVPLVMKLLSPAHRPVQVTTDLASFWRDAYFEVRKDLRGRYPKHYWPEDPLTATPTRRVRPPPDGS